MNLSRSGLYALHGLAFLAGCPSGTFVPLSTISRRSGLPRTYLAKIFQALLRSGLVKSARGVRGGFALAHPAGTITALGILRRIEGPYPTPGCPIHPESRTPGRCCAVARTVRKGQTAVADLFRRTTLADLSAPERGE